MFDKIKKLQAEKKEYRRHMERVRQLPEEYRFVFEKMQAYMWSFAGGDGRDMLKTQYELLELFEEGAARGKAVLDLTGKDVAGFCQQLIQGNRLWLDGRRERLNRQLEKQGKGNICEFCGNKKRP